MRKLEILAVDALLALTSGRTVPGSGPAGARPGQDR